MCRPSSGKRNDQEAENSRRPSEKVQHEDTVDRTGGFVKYVPFLQVKSTGEKEFLKRLLKSEGIDHFFKEEKGTAQTVPEPSSLLMVARISLARVKELTDSSRLKNSYIIET